jgi:hypothetical protein
MGASSAPSSAQRSLRCSTGSPLIASPRASILRYVAAWLRVYADEYERLAAGIP